MHGGIETVYAVWGVAAGGLFPDSGGEADGAVQRVSAGVRAEEVRAEEGGD
jgi:hypothetical protein